jgi:hypothetical protein
LDAASVVSVPLDVRIRKLDGILTVARRGRALELSETAAFIWQQVDGHRAVTEALAVEYDIERESALADTLETIEALVTHRLLTLVETR